MAMCQSMDCKSANIVNISVQYLIFPYFRHVSKKGTRNIQWLLVSWRQGRFLLLFQIRKNHFGCRVKLEVKEGGSNHKMFTFSHTRLAMFLLSEGGVSQMQGSPSHYRNASMSKNINLEHLFMYCGNKRGRYHFRRSGSERERGGVIFLLPYY